VGSLGSKPVPFLSTLDKEFHMNLNISARHFDLTPAMEGYAKTKFEKVWNHFDIISAHLRLADDDGGAKLAQADIHIKGKDLHIEEREPDLYAAIDKLAEATHVALKREKERRAKK
jgi:putative sigma-54 modulation protein